MYDREEDLKQNINSTIAHIFDLPEVDYYSRLTNAKLLALKSGLKNVNNIITLQLTSCLGDLICQGFSLRRDQMSSVSEKIRSSRPNANGFDIELDFPNVVAEVKSNIPINGGQCFGSNQKTGLIKDIEGLLYGKPKAKKDISRSLRLLGLYDSPHIRSATTHLLKSLPVSLKNAVCVLPSHKTMSSLDTNMVYIVFLTMK